MIKYIKTLIIVLGGFTLQAQPDTKDSVDIEIDGGRIIVDAGNLESLSALDLNKMISQVVEKSLKIQRQHRELIARVDKQEANGEITEEEAEDMREAINDRTEESMEVISELMETWGETYAERWEAWAERYEEEMEAWEDAVENRSKTDGVKGIIPPIPPLPDLPLIPGESSAAPVDTGDERQKIIISDDGIIIQQGDGNDKPFALKFKDKEIDTDDRDHKKIDRTETYFDFNIGFNQLLEDGQFVISDEPGELNWWKSKQVELGLGGKTRLGSPYSKLYLKWGGEFSWHDFRLKGNNILDKSQALDRSVFRPDSSKGSYSKSKYEIVYFNIPLMLQLDFSEVGEMDESFTFGVGGYGGVRVSSGREVEYNDFEGSEVDEDTKNDFFTNSFRYGVMTQIGWKSFKITAKYDLNTFFQDGRSPLNSDNEPGNYQMASINLGWSW